ncbi:acyltransferase [Cryobacterium adonitolivorans]|uniref:Acyltransferase n=1 Tax=Cryobacterium adonitolivorans TaxID=1259189 RepID=A0A4R8WBL7_9MICO|nr:acyltransferase [Cryobacterium adonitolivorans]TFC05539.1 acyltransferase [Cryobacterium adonitolivorans]
MSAENATFPPTDRPTSGNPRSPTELARRPEFPYLDGIRGFSAIAVVLYHALLFTGLSNEATRSLPLIDLIFGWGYLGVPVFIVLSGYVLMLPTLSNDFRLRGGMAKYLKRRARRVIPPYYAALLISILLIVVLPVMQEPSGTQWDTKLPVTVQSVVSHFLLVHNFSPDWIDAINGPLWSVAVEWQIYILFPLILLPLCRRNRTGLVVIGAVIISLSPVFTGVGVWAHPWLIGIFAMGMWSAQATMSPVKNRWAGPLFLGFIALTLVAIVLTKQFDIRSFGLIETCAGAAVAAGLVWTGQRAVRGATPWFVKPFQSRPMIRLGLFSYSIYLLHSPLLALANLLLLPLGLPLEVQWMVMTFAGVPVVVAVCYGFFFVVERRFLNTRQRHAETELASDATPATDQADGVPSQR